MIAIRPRPCYAAAILLAAAALAGGACGKSEFEGGGDLRARKVVLKREVDGLHEIVSRLERGEPMLPKDDVAISISGALVRDLITAQLPFDLDVDRFHVRLSEADVLFRGSPVVKLRGTLVIARAAGLRGRDRGHRRARGHPGRPRDRDAQRDDRGGPHLDREGGRAREAPAPGDPRRGRAHRPPAAEGRAAEDRRSR